MATRKTTRPVPTTPKLYTPKTMDPTMLARFEELTSEGFSAAEAAEMMGIQVNPVSFGRLGSANKAPSARAGSSTSNPTNTVGSNTTKSGRTIPKFKNDAGTKGSKLKSQHSKLSSKGASGRSMINKNGWVANHVGDFEDLTNAQLDWNPGSGVTGWGKNLGALWAYGDAAVQGVKAFKGFQDNSEVRDSIGDLQSDIVLSAANSPTIWHDLNADQRDLLRQLQRGTYESKGDIGDVDGLGVLGDAAMGALAGLPGGIPGAILGAVGGGINSVIDDIGNSANRDAAELEALYQAVLESEQYHNEKRKQRAYSALY